MLPLVRLWRERFQKSEDAEWGTCGLHIRLLPFSVKVRWTALHWRDIGAMLSNFTGDFTVYSAVFFPAKRKKLGIEEKSSASMALCKRNPSVPDGFPSQKVSNVWWSIYHERDIDNTASYIVLSFYIHEFLIYTILPNGSTNEYFNWLNSYKHSRQNVSF